MKPDPADYFDWKDELAEGARVPSPELTAELKRWVPYTPGTPVVFSAERIDAILGRMDGLERREFWTKHGDEVKRLRDAWFRARIKHDDKARIEEFNRRNAQRDEAR